MSLAALVVQAEGPLAFELLLIFRENENIRQVSSSTRTRGHIRTQGSSYRQQASLVRLQNQVAILEMSFLRFRIRPLLWLSSATFKMILAP